MAGKKKAKKRAGVKQIRSPKKAAVAALVPVEEARGGKVQVTLRLDADVVDFFRAKGPGYQGKMEGYLHVMMAQRKFQAEADDPGEPWIDTHPKHESMGNTIFRPRKVQMALRLDGELLRWYRATGKGYQTKMNRDLRLVMVEMVSADEANEAS
jgi:uncharacterized protein (DUF4415 family)